MISMAPSWQFLMQKAGHFSRFELAVTLHSVPRHHPRMKCIVTAGPTYEPLDRVRRLTNFSTGRLGTELANFLTARGHEVTLLIGEQATWRGERNAHSVETFSTTSDLQQRLQQHASHSVQAVFHAAAVSDFGFGKIWRRSADGSMLAVEAGKVPTHLEGLLAELVPTPKIIRGLRPFFLEACIVGWKFETDGNRAEVLQKAAKQMAESQTDACVANGPAYGAGFGLLPSRGELLSCATAPELFEALEQLAGRPKRQ
jgi:phosphopantothenoylcysteine decarboxylase/phosphopantothenate--cysteine ligase